MRHAISRVSARPGLGDEVIDQHGVVDLVERHVVERGRAGDRADADEHDDAERRGLEIPARGAAEAAGRRVVRARAEVIPAQRLHSRERDAIRAGRERIGARGQIGGQLVARVIQRHGDVELAVPIRHADAVAQAPLDSPPRRGQRRGQRQVHALDLVLLGQPQAGDARGADVVEIAPHRRPCARGHEAVRVGHDVLERGGVVAVRVRRQAVHDADALLLEHHHRAAPERRDVHDLVVAAVVEPKGVLRVGVARVVADVAHGHKVLLVRVDERHEQAVLEERRAVGIGNGLRAAAGIRVAGGLRDGLPARGKVRQHERFAGRAAPQDERVKRLRERAVAGQGVAVEADFLRRAGGARGKRAPPGGDDHPLVPVGVAEEGGALDTHGPNVT